MATGWNREISKFLLKVSARPGVRTVRLVGRRRFEPWAGLLTPERAALNAKTSPIGQAKPLAGRAARHYARINPRAAPVRPGGPMWEPGENLSARPRFLRAHAVYAGLLR